MKKAALSYELIQRMTDGYSRIRFFDEIDSTNGYCKREAASLAHGDAVIAARQTAGRGRMGRSFTSGEGGLYMSVVIKPSIKAEDALPLTGMTAVAVVRAIKKLCGITAGVKWMNDLIIGDRKIAGILVEMGISGASEKIDYAVVGVGINVSTRGEDFPEDIRTIAGSLLECGKAAPDPNELASYVICGILEVSRDLEAGNVAGYTEEYRSLCVSLDRPSVMIRDGKTVSVVPVAVDDKFGLVVRHEDGVLEAVRFGEVSVKAETLS